MVVRKIKNVFVKSIDYAYLRYGYIKTEEKGTILISDRKLSFPG